VSSSAFYCSVCKGQFEANEVDYVASEWFPGKPNGKNLIFFEGYKLLKFCGELSFRMPSTSERKIIETLSVTSSNNGRVII